MGTQAFEFFDGYDLRQEGMVGKAGAKRRAPATRPVGPGSRPVGLDQMLGGGSSITLFRMAGIRVSVDWSWFVVLFLVIVWMSGFYRDILGDPDSQFGPYALALASAIGFFGSILLHEFGHAWAAKRRGIGTSSIQLWIFGGVANLDRDSDSPRTEFEVAIAGPLVTLAIVLALVAVTFFSVGSSGFADAMLIRTGGTSSGVLAMIAWLGSINLLVLIFNLLPAFPMDGGRIVRAAAWARTGERSKATRFAARLGVVFAYIFIAGGLALIFSGLVITGIWLAMVGFILSGSARAATMQTSISGRLEGLTVADVMDPEPVAIPAEISVDEAMDEYFLRYRWPWFPVVDAARVFRGLAELEHAEEIEAPSRGTMTVAELIRPGSGADRYRVQASAPLDSLLGRRELGQLGALMAIDAEGRLLGVITADQVGRALRNSGAGGER